jgi:hypothetical protein
MELKQQQLSTEVDKILLNFQNILNCAQISNDKVQSLREGLQISVNTCSLISSAENLLTWTSELKEGFLFYDFEMTNQINSEKNQQLILQTSQGDLLIKKIEMTINESLFELEENLKNSIY